MAAVYGMSGCYLAEGLQGSDKCDAAWQMACEIAKETEEDVVLEDDDGTWIIRSDGSREEAGAEWS